MSEMPCSVSKSWSLVQAGLSEAEATRVIASTAAEALGGSPTRTGIVTFFLQHLQCGFGGGQAVCVHNLAAPAATMHEGDLV